MKGPEKDMSFKVSLIPINMNSVHVTTTLSSLT